MKSAWFWHTKEWAEYQQAYYHGQMLDEYKSSPLANDHDFEWERERTNYDLSVHETMVLDLTPARSRLWQGVRKSYHSIINSAQRDWDIEPCDGIADYWGLHSIVNGGKPVRHAETYRLQGQWLDEGYGLLVVAHPFHSGHIVAAAYWIVYRGCAYYMSGPSLEKNIQHAVIWRSLELLKAKGVRLVEMGEVHSGGGKRASIQHFKAGFGGCAYPFTVATRRM